MENSKRPTFLNCMGRVTDPRRPYNQLHVFLDIVAIAVLAALCGADTWDGVESWGERLQRMAVHFPYIRKWDPNP